MKKSLVALAVLTAVGAASAQSNVTLYGVADVWVGKTKNGDAQLGSGGLATSRLGFKGTEDLGGGLKVHFNLEQAIRLDTGATVVPGSLFSRQANVGLSGGFGSVKLGRSFTAFDDINGAANSGFDSALSATSPVWVGYTDSANAQIYYATPEMSGLSGAVGFTLKGNQAAANPTNDITSLHLKYSRGPIYAGFAYQDEKSATGPSTKHMLLNGSYDLGMAVIKASYRNVQNTVADNTFYSIFTNRKANEYQVGVDVPVNDRLTLSAGYAASKLKGVDPRPGANPDAGSIRNSAGYGLAAGYTLSKRTLVYGGFNASKTNGVKDNFVAAGVNHTF
jgi:predicted porin